MWYTKPNKTKDKLWGKYMDTVGDRLRKIRKARGYTQKYVAEQAGIHEVLYRRYEHGDRNPKESTLIKIAQVLEVDPMIFQNVSISMFDSLPALLYNFSNQCNGNLQIIESDGAFYVGIKNGELYADRWNDTVKVIKNKQETLSSEEFQTWLLMSTQNSVYFEVIRERQKSAKQDEN